MNNSQDYILYSYAFGDQVYHLKPDNNAQTGSNTIAPRHLVQMIPARSSIVQANGPRIRIVENVQLRKPTQQIQIVCDESSSYYTTEAESNSSIPIVTQESQPALEDVCSTVTSVSMPEVGNTVKIQMDQPAESETIAPSDLIDPVKAPKRGRKPGPNRASLKLQKMTKKQRDPATIPVMKSTASKVAVSKSKKGFIYECDICDSRFLSATSLKLHKTGHRYAAPDEKKAFSCRYCGRQFSHMQTLGDHEKVHIDDRYNCSACGAKYSSKSGLRNHLAKNVECGINYQDLKLRRKREEEEDKEHGCEICGKKYRHRKSLLEHRSLHFRNKQRKCDRCGVMFETIGGWRKHTANKRCEFSKSKYKDPGEQKDEVFIPEERRKFLEQTGELKVNQPLGEVQKRKPKRKRKISISTSSDDEASSDHDESAFNEEEEEDRQLSIELVTIPEAVIEAEELIPDTDILGEKESPLEIISPLEPEIKDEVLSDDNDNELPAEEMVSPVAVDKGKTPSVRVVELSEVKTEGDKNVVKDDAIELLRDVVSSVDNEPNYILRSDVDDESDDSVSLAETLRNEPATVKCATKESVQKSSRKPKVHQCPKCNKTFSRRFVLKTHLRVHTGERPFLCDSCPKVFGDAAALKVHAVVHTGEKPFPCPECPARFARKSGLRNHITVHFNLPCDECDQMFPSRKTLMRHKIKHKGIRPFLCEICSKDFRTKADMKAHMRIHSDEKRYSCPVCAARFNCPSTLRRHRNVHAPPETRPVCETCGKSFSSQQALRKHENIHKDLKPFECDICSKRFRVKDHLKIHHRSHSGEKPFECDICSKRFVANGDLRVHYRRHTGEKPYCCDECGMAFVVTAGLYRHQQQTGHKSSKPIAIIVPNITRAT